MIRLHISFFVCMRIFKVLVPLKRNGTDACNWWRCWSNNIWNLIIIYWIEKFMLLIHNKMLPHKRMNYRNTRWKRHVQEELEACFNRRPLKYEWNSTSVLFLLRMNIESRPNQKTHFSFCSQLIMCFSSRLLIFHYGVTQLCSWI